ncbi:hypothetical protein BH24ACT12_BH24ACT12_24660 [soil metagenome]
MSVHGQQPSEVIGARIRDLRIARGWSQHRLARRLSEDGLTLGQSNLARLENGKRDVTVSDLFTLALALDCPPLTLLAPETDTEQVMVGARGENPSRLRAWIVGRQPLDTVRGQQTYREHTGRMREAGSGLTVGPFLREMADQLDADGAEGQVQIIDAAIAYLRGARRGVQHRANSTTSEED